MSFCPACGASNDPSVRFCGSCGTPLSEAAGKAGPAPTSHRRATGRVGSKILVAAVLTVAALAVAAFFLWPMSEQEYEDGARDVLRDATEVLQGLSEVEWEFEEAAFDGYADYDDSDEIPEDAVEVLRDAFEQYSEDIKAIERDVRALRPPAKYRDADLFLRGVASYLSGDVLEKIDDFISELEEGMTYDEFGEGIEDLGKDLAFYEIWEDLEEEFY